MSFFNNAQDSDSTDNSPLLAIPHDTKLYPEANRLIEKIEALEASIHETWEKLDAKATWLPVSELGASSTKTDLSVVMQDGYAEIHASDNAKAHSVYTLDATPPGTMNSLSAFRLTYLPKDEKKALTDAEWGASLNHITVEKISADGSKKPLKLIDVIADEAHPIHDPLASLKKSGDGWGTHYKFFRPRHATFVFEQEVSLASGEIIRLTIQNGGTYLSSFPLVAKRSRIAFSADPGWISMQSGGQISSLRKELQAAEAALKKIPSVRIPVIAERDPEHARITNFFNRGNWLDKGEAVEKAGTPRVFPPLKPRSDKPDRLDLARQRRDVAIPHQRAKPPRSPVLLYAVRLILGQHRMIDDDHFVAVAKGQP